MTRIVAVIPARMGSSRFPGKPLAPIHGRSMLEHVFRRTSACPLLDEAFIATCDSEIASAVATFGARAVMTSDRHERASDRVVEACVGDSAGIVVMVQGDEPMIVPDMVSAAIEPLREDEGIQCVNLSARIRTREELVDPNTIKTVMNCRHDALYFSRMAIPYRAKHDLKADRWHKQVCVIAFRRAALESFSTLPQGELESAESIDMLRFLENDIPVRLVETGVYTHAVDSPKDVDLVESLMPADGSWERR